MSAITEVPSAIVRPFLSPKTLLIGLGVTAGTLFLLARILPGIGQMVGLRTSPLVPIPYFPFQPRNGNGGSPTPEARPESTSSDVNTASGYINTLLQVV